MTHAPSTPEPGWFDELAVMVEQPVVDAPSVDPDGCQRAGSGRELEPALGLGHEA